MVYWWYWNVAVLIVIQHICGGVFMILKCCSRRNADILTHLNLFGTLPTDWYWSSTSLDHWIPHSSVVMVLRVLTFSSGVCAYRKSMFPRDHGDCVVFATLDILDTHWFCHCDSYLLNLYSPVKQICCSITIWRYATRYSFPSHPLCFISFRVMCGVRLYLPTPNWRVTIYFAVCPWKRWFTSITLASLRVLVAIFVAACTSSSWHSPGRMDNTLRQ